MQTGLLLWSRHANTIDMRIHSIEFRHVAQNYLIGHSAIRRRNGTYKLDTGNTVREPFLKRPHDLLRRSVQSMAPSGIDASREQSQHQVGTVHAADVET